MLLATMFHRLVASRMDGFTLAGLRLIFVWRRFVGCESKITHTSPAERAKSGLTVEILTFLGHSYGYPQISKADR